MLCGGSRASVHLLDHRHSPTLGAKVLRQSSFVLRPCSAKPQQPMKSSSSRSHCKTPAPLDCFRFLNLAVVLIVYVSESDCLM